MSTIPYPVRLKCRLDEAIWEASEWEFFTKNILDQKKMEETAEAMHAMKELRALRERLTPFLNEMAAQGKQEAQG